MKQMISLSGDYGGLTPHCTFILFAYLAFPDGPASRYQAVILAESEQKRYVADPEKYEASELIRGLLQLKTKADGQRSVTGLSFLAFQYLSLRGRPNVTIYAAQKLVEKSLQAARTNGHPLLRATYERGEWQINDVRYPSSRKDIGAAFKRFACVGHIIAAELLCATMFEIDLLFERTDEMNVTVLNAAKDIELFLKVEQAGLYEDLFRIVPAIPADLIFSGPVSLDNSIIEFFDAGFS